MRLFGFIAGYETRSFGEQDPVNIKAAEKLGKLHDQLKAVGYEGHPLEVFLVRLLFCLFAEDNAIFERQQFKELVELRSAEDGSDLAALLANLFQVLDTPPLKRLKNLDEQLAAFAYINGNPPFLGKKEQSSKQKAELTAIFHDVDGASVHRAPGDGARGRR